MSRLLLPASAEPKPVALSPRALALREMCRLLVRATTRAGNPYYGTSSAWYALRARDERAVEEFLDGWHDGASDAALAGNPARASYIERFGVRGRELPPILFGSAAA